MLVFASFIELMSNGGMVFFFTLNSILSRFRDLGGSISQALNELLSPLRDLKQIRVWLWFSSLSIVFCLDLDIWEGSISQALNELLSPLRCYRDLNQIRVWLWFSDFTFITLSHVLVDLFLHS